MGNATRLTAVTVRTAKPGRHADGRDGLYLLVRETGWRGWVFRYKHAKRPREMGLGRALGLGAVSLSDARAAVARHRVLLAAGIDPLAKRQAEEAAAIVIATEAAVAGVTFRDVATQCMDARDAGLRNAKHRAQWRSTLETYAFPFMGDLPVASVATDHVMAVLQPIWTAKPETAGRVRGRIEAVLDYAKARGWRDGENPTRWKGHLDQMLAARSKVRAVVHHAALPWQEVAAFMVALRARDGVGARALRFAILTAARSGEARGATWADIDLPAAVWTIPAGRMKAGRMHRVPLAPAAVDLLREMATLRLSGDQTAMIFAGLSGGQMSDMSLTATLRRMGHGDITAHGFRSTFRDWAAEHTAYPGELAEAALAHTVGSKTEAAYRRGDLFDKRRAMMNDWAEFCSLPGAVRGDPVRLGREAGS